MKKKKVLLLFTQTYPFGKDETFVHNEIDFLSKEYSQIIIITSNTESPLTFSTAENITSIRKNFNLSKKQKVSSIQGMFSWIVIKEIILKTQLNLKQISYLLQSWHKSKIISNFIIQLVEERKLQPNNLVLYSYWWLDEAIGIAQYKKSNIEAIAITRAHGYDLYNYRSIVNYLPLKEFSAAHLNRVYCISNDGLLYAKNKLKIDNVELQRLGTINETNPNLYKESQLFRIVSCSSIYPNKNVHKIAEVIGLLDNITVEWIHFGGPFDKLYQSYYTGFLETVSKLKNNKNTTLKLMGKVNNSEVLRYYRENQVDLFINLSNSEGVPVSIMEAMSFGIPCLATAVGGTPEIVNEKNGFLVETKCSPDFISKIIYDFLTQEKSNKVRKRDLAYFTWSDKYNGNKNYPKFIQSIAELD